MTKRLKIGLLLSGILIFNWVQVIKTEELLRTVKASWPPDRDNNLLVTAVTSSRRSKNSCVPQSFYNTSKNCNPHNYKYIINPSNFCLQHKQVFLLIMVRTILDQIDRRMAIRSTWGSVVRITGQIIKVIFLFGITDDAKKQKAILTENSTYKDILQENFLESYKNLTLKTIMAWKWARNYCYNAAYIMVSNDEVFVDIYKLIAHLEKEASRPTQDDHYALCYTYHCCTMVNRKGKHSVSSQVYAGKCYPAFCHGVSNIASIEVINKLYLMSLETPMFMPDDNWSGILAEKLSIKPGYNEAFYTGIVIKPGKPDVVRQFLQKAYPKSSLIFGVLDRQYSPKVVAIYMKYLWSMLTERYYKNSTESLEKVTKINNIAFAQLEYKSIANSIMTESSLLELVFGFFVISLCIIIIFLKKTSRSFFKAFLDKF